MVPNSSHTTQIQNDGTLLLWVTDVSALQSVKAFSTLLLDKNQGKKI